MDWTCTVRGSTLREDELTNGEHEGLFLLVNSGIPHTEAQISPAHCPTCRNAILIVALGRAGIPIEAARELVAGMTREEAINCFIPDIPDDASAAAVAWTSEPDAGEHLEQTVT